MADRLTCEGMRMLDDFDQADPFGDHLALLVITNDLDRPGTLATYASDDAVVLDEFCSLVEGRNGKRYRYLLGRYRRRDGRRQS